MKSVTEFANFTLANGIKAKAALTAEGKTPEEIQTALGETFKYEGDKLKYFVSAVDVAAQNPEKLKRVVVISLNEGEAAPAKALKVDEMHYVPEFINDVKYQAPAKTDAKGGRNQRGGGGPRREGGAPKSSPWGMSPEELAAKKAKSQAAKASN